MRLPFARPRRAGLLADETFVRGLTLGALIGAAIAGSTLWSRLRRSGRAAEAESTQPEPTA